MTEPKFMTTEDAIVSTLTEVRDYRRPAPSTYLLACGMNTVASSLRPTLDRLTLAGLVVQVSPADLPPGVEQTPGDQRWALTSDKRFPTA